jgi:hypothetical protein
MMRQDSNDLTSPFLSDDLFADEGPVETPAFSSSLLNESPFLQGFSKESLNPASSAEELYVDEFSSEDAQAFPESDYEQWSGVEYDVPTAGSSNAPDPLLAVPAFTTDKRASTGTLLTPAKSRAAIRWNAQNHPRKSGVDPGNILAALQSYVDPAAINDAIANYNSQNSTAPINLGAKPVDAVFVEAIHQFQMKCYRDSKQHDGFAGASVLDSLGFWPRRGLISSAQTNEWAKGLVRSRRSGIAAALSTSTDLTRDLTYSNWWNAFVNPCFLGWGFVRPIHIYFARKLRKAELWLLSQSRFTGKTPAELAALLDIDEKHAGGRSKSGSKSIHTLGLGIDIKYLGNPHIGDYRDKPLGAQRFSEVMKRAVAKISGLTLVEEKFPEYLNKLGTDTSKTTGQIYDELIQRDQDLRKYLALAEARADLTALRRGVFKGSQERDPLKGFLNMDRDLVIALRDHACLVWGAVDFGPGANGDIMHFDCRLDDLGRAVFCGTGGTFNDKHPCWKRSEPPCPQAPARPSRAGTHESEVPHSECEDEYGDEVDEFLKDQSVEDLADESEEFAEELTEELDETGELNEFENFLVETEESEEELLEAEAPPLLKNPAKSDPPGQTLYVEIKLGKDSRCVKWVEENKKKKCVQYTTFVIRPMTGIFIPENYSPQKAVDLILYLHGHKTDIPGSDALIAEYWDGRKYPVFALREEINASRKNVILVAPTLALKSEAGDLVRRNGLDNYLNKVLEALTTYGPYKGQSPTIGNLILAAHSGGGIYMRKLATSGNQAAGKIRECWGFDSLYNSSDVGPWRLWAKDYPKTRFLYSYYRHGLPRTNSESLDKNSRGRIEKLPNVFPIPSQEKDHFKLVRLYLRERLQGTTFLNSTSVGAHEANELSGAPSENQFLQASSEAVGEEALAENFYGKDTSEGFTTEALASEGEEHEESLAGEWEAEDEFDELERQGDFDEAEDVELEDEVVFTDREKYEDESPLFEAFAPKVSASDLRAHIDDYFEKANAEYDLGGGVKVKARPQFRYAKAGGTEEAIVKVKGILGAQFEKRHPRAIRYAAYGRAKPSDIAAITQGLIDAGELRAAQSAHPGLSDQQSVRMLQREFKMGIDCAGYVQLAFIFAFMGNDDDTRKVRLNLGLDQRRGYEKLASLPSSHFKKVAVTDAQTGDLFVLKPRADSGDRAWHTVIVVDHTVSRTIHSFLVDASWGTDLYGLDAGGVARRTLIHDASSGKWWDVHPINGTKAHENSTGPYNGHPIHGMYRAKQKK